MYTMLEWVFINDHALIYSKFTIILFSYDDRDSWVAGAGVFS
jgi:hypothetical protein